MQGTVKTTILPRAFATFLAFFFHLEESDFLFLGFVEVGGVISIDTINTKNGII